MSRTVMLRPLPLPTRVGRVSARRHSPLNPFCLGSHGSFVTIPNRRFQLNCSTATDQALSQSTLSVESEGIFSGVRR